VGEGPGVGVGGTGVGEGSGGRGVSVTGMVFGVMTTTIGVDNDRGSKPMGVGVVAPIGGCCRVLTGGVLTKGGGGAVGGRITTGVGF